jgi:hypothetical protein
MPKTEGHGRPAKQAKILEALKNGNTRRASFQSVGLSSETFYRWLETNQTFSNAVMEAEAAAELTCAGTILACAEGGDWRAADKWLSKRRRDDWADEINVRDLSIDQLLALARASAGAVGQPEDRVAAAGRNGDREPDPVP